MFTLAHATLLIAGTFLAWWLWQVLGQRDYALALVRRHCERNALQLLDDSVALSGVRLSRLHRGRYGLVRRYAFEFTVTGEHRYSGYIDLHGTRQLHIELAPHPFPHGKDDEPATETARESAKIYKTY